VVATLDRFDLADFDALQRQLTSVLALFSRFVASHAIDIGQEMFAFVAELFITVYMAFFLIRDGESIVKAVRRALPLAPEHRAELSDKFAAVVRATVNGSLLVAAIQGALGGLGFWFLGVRAALLRGVLMAFLSLLPALGAALVWLPVALYLLVSAPLWQGLALIAYGVAVIGLADNVLRPMLVGRDTRMPDYVVMITTLGGMATIGINGFVVGPTVAAMFIAV
jgi:predicted PurR-regulated permease PerM